MNASTKAQERRLRDADYRRREQPRMLWASTHLGTAIRVDTRYGSDYTSKPPVPKKSGARKLTEAEDNAIGRSIRRRKSRRLRAAGKPHAQR